MSEPDSKPEIAKPSKRRRPWRRYVLLAVVSVGIGWYSLPFWDAHAEQDQCTFGTGSTALYDGLRAEAEVYLEQREKARLSGYSPESARKFADQVLKQFREFAMSRSTAIERWAAIHALARAYGMDFDSNGPRSKTKLESDRVQLETSYIILLPKLNWLCPVCFVFREAAFNLQITNRGDGKYGQIDGGLRIRSFSLTWGPVYHRRFYQICPQVLK